MARQNEVVISQLGKFLQVIVIILMISIFISNSSANKISNHDITMMTLIIVVSSAAAEVSLFIFSIPYTRSPKQDSRLEDFRQGLGCSEILFFIGSG